MAVLFKYINNSAADIHDSVSGWEYHKNIIKSVVKNWDAFMSSSKVIKSFYEDFNDDNDQSILYLVLSMFFSINIFFARYTSCVSRSEEPGEEAPSP